MWIKVVVRVRLCTWCLLQNVRGWCRIKKTYRRGLFCLSNTWLRLEQRDKNYVKMELIAVAKNQTTQVVNVTREQMILSLIEVHKNVATAIGNCNITIIKEALEDGVTTTREHRFWAWGCEADVDEAWLLVTGRWRSYPKKMKYELRIQRKICTCNQRMVFSPQSKRKHSTAGFDI